MVLCRYNMNELLFWLPKMLLLPLLAIVTASTTPCDSGEDGEEEGNETNIAGMTLTNKIWWISSTTLAQNTC